MQEEQTFTLSCVSRDGEYHDLVFATAIDAEEAARAIEEHLHGFQPTKTHCFKNMTFTVPFNVIETKDGRKWQASFFVSVKKLYSSLSYPGSPSY